jgi:starvation-inducible outer membrane lipoprotein
MTGTLICDEDGLYNPNDFNDRLLLGMKGQMSEALCGYRHKASYAYFAVMPTTSCEYAADLAGSASRSA